LLPCDRLHYIAHWITPLGLPRRFTTRFFAAALPAGQEASHDGAELTDSRWSTAAAALAADRDGELDLPPPTRMTLQQLAGYGSVDALLRWAKQRQSGGVEACLPAIVGAAGEEHVVMPGQPDYPPHGGDEP
ncbi:MAG TPA: hypothetical protein VFE85_01715, partial [Woeseiaceae bacterium]|nr:hypothetical protein [Woeseiaceae bacterium]